MIKLSIYIIIHFWKRSWTSQLWELLCPSVLDFWTIEFVTFSKNQVGQTWFLVYFELDFSSDQINQNKLFFHLFFHPFYRGVNLVIHIFVARTRPHVMQIIIYTLPRHRRRHLAATLCVILSYKNHWHWHSAMPAEAALITLQAEQGGWLTGVPYANS